MATAPKIYPKPDPCAQFTGTIYWTCEKCGKCHRTRVKPGRWHIRCTSCEKVFVLGCVIARLPAGPFRVPIDVAIPAELKRNAAANESYAGPGDGYWMETEYSEIKSGGRAHRVKDIPEPLSDSPRDCHYPNPYDSITDK